LNYIYTGEYETMTETEPATTGETAPARTPETASETESAKTGQAGKSKKVQGAAEASKRVEYLLAHANAWIAADFYGIPGLQHLSLSKFVDGVSYLDEALKSGRYGESHMKMASRMPEVVEFIYKNTPPSNDVHKLGNSSLRAAIVMIVIRHRSTIIESSEEDSSLSLSHILDTYGEFAKDLSLVFLSRTCGDLSKLCCTHRDLRERSLETCHNCLIRSLGMSRGC
jgi:hypothetical protein